MKKLFIIAATVLAVTGSGCTDQRDLYVKAGPLIYVEGDWMPSLGKSDMTMDATAVSFTSSGYYTKEYFYDPDFAEIPADKGTYDVMIFNGLMYSPTDTHLDNIYFRGTDQLGTFEAVAAEGQPNRRLNRADEEYIANNEMEIITSAVGYDVSIDGKEAYYLKYKNGENGFEVPESYIEAELFLTPQAMNYETKVLVTVSNITSAYSASAALYGFIGSVFMETRMPSHFYVTHQFNLNSKKVTDPTNDIGTIESPHDMVTFGPPVDAPANKYEVYIKTTLVNNKVQENTFDVTDQIEPYIDEINANLSRGRAEEKMTILILINLDLPYVEPVDGEIGVGDWSDDEIIRVPIKP